MAAVASLTPDAEICERIKDPEKFNGVVATCKWIVTRLMEVGLAKKVILAPKDLGMHPANRSKYGANHESVHNLGSDIVKLGYDQDLVVTPLCVEEDPQDRYIEEYNVKMTENSTFLAPVAPLSTVAGTLTNSRLVLLLRALLAGVDCKHETLAVDGRMSIAHVETRSPEMAQAARSGWTWTMLSHHCRRLYGEPLFELLSSIKNINLQRSDNEVQCLLKILNLACEYKRNGQ